MSPVYRPFAEPERARIAATFRTPIVSIDDFSRRRRAVVAGASECAALAGLAAGDASFEPAFLGRIAPAWIAALLRLLETEPTLELHAVGAAQRSSYPRTELSPWIAHLLFGSLPTRGEDHPSLDGSGLLERSEPHVAAKLRAVLSYFERIGREPPAGRFEIERVVVAPRSAAEWRADASPLGVFAIDDDGAIEDAHQHRQADFANAFLGGGVLRRGCSQEEIRFSVSPELLFGLVVSPRMRDDEAILLRGSERFARTRGYSRSLAWAGDFRDGVPRADDGTPETEVVAMDAIAFAERDLRAQLEAPVLLRELGKARTAFRKDVRGWPVATGNWGSGAFQGDPGIKAVVQWIAASSEGRAIRYCPFRDARVARLGAFVERARERFVTAGALFDALMTSSRAGIVATDDFLERLLDHAVGRT